MKPYGMTLPVRQQVRADSGLYRGWRGSQKYGHVLHAYFLMPNTAFLVGAQSLSLAKFMVGLQQSYARSS
jgi:hypothetical protein